MSVLLFGPTLSTNNIKVYSMLELKVILKVLLAILVLITYAWLILFINDWIDIDSCLDRGGCWDYKYGYCRVDSSCAACEKATDVEVEKPDGQSTD